MKFLAEVYTPEERSRIEGLLYDKGIPTYARGFGRAGSSSTALGCAIFVCIDLQFDDAVALMGNPDHSVANPVDVAEFNGAIDSADITPIAKWLILPLAIVVAMALVVAYLSHGKIA